MLRLLGISLMLAVAHAINSCDLATCTASGSPGVSNCVGNGEYCCSGTCKNVDTLPVIALGAACDVTTPCAGMCQTGTTCSGAKCVVPVDGGCACALDTDCFDMKCVNSVCLSRQPQGGSCPAGHYPTYISSNVCHPSHAVGTNCTLPSIYSSGLSTCCTASYPDISMFDSQYGMPCVALKATGSVCSGHHECTTGYCSGTCAALPAAGTVAAGSICLQDAQCVTGHFCSKIFGSCSPTPAAGLACSTSYSCYTNGDYDAAVAASASGATFSPPLSCTIAGVCGTSFAGATGSNCTSGEHCSTRVCRYESAWHATVGWKKCLPDYVAGDYCQGTCADDMQCTMASATATSYTCVVEYSVADGAYCQYANSKLCMKGSECEANVCVKKTGTSCLTSLSGCGAGAECICDRAANTATCALEVVETYGSCTLPTGSSDTPVVASPSVYGDFFCCHLCDATQEKRDSFTNLFDTDWNGRTRSGVIDCATKAITVATHCEKNTPVGVTVSGCPVATTTGSSGMMVVASPFITFMAVLALVVLA